MNVEKQEIRIQCDDGVVLRGSRFQDPGKPSRGTLVLCSALGVSRNFYESFARFFSGHGFSVLSFDYRGTGESQGEDPNLCLEDWGRQDIRAAIASAKTGEDSGPVFLVGHSVGGQLFCLADNCRDLSGVILAGASFPHWTRWPFPRKLLMLFFFHILVPFLGWGRKRFPTRMLGLSREDMPASLIRRWVQLARHPDYVLGEDFGLDTAGFRELSCPVLSFGFDDDTYAPEKAVKKLLGSFKQARIDSRFLPAAQVSSRGVGHFGYFKEDCAGNLWQDTLNWLNHLE